MPGSNDIDFVSKDSREIADALVLCGFKKTDFQFRYRHPDTNILIELVNEHIMISGIRKVATVEVDPKDIDARVVRSLMPGTAVLFVFLLTTLKHRVMNRYGSTTTIRAR